MPNARGRRRSPCGNASPSNGVRTDAHAISSNQPGATHAGVAAEYPVHTLLRIDAAQIAHNTAPPPWAIDSLRRTPWVVVRRVSPRDGLIPVGVRGAGRA